ncbi:DUF669 domain-containing protein [uncultured Ruegeria sp.]|uniref:DUF669 domain-containing protein n=1 Tax=uncultured Ruegeria sp. TaxID=259304 RepID=UPI002605AE12|nr:DUF669 domain-containing protein [uncultured Ruegeria sp.]
MANLGGSYDATNGQTMDDRTALPAGEYVAAIVKSERQESKSKPGNAYINCEFEVQEGDAQGRRFWTMLNLWNDNSQAVEIAQRELNSIMHACGKLRVEDTDELHGIPMRVKLKVENNEQYGPQNRVATYKPLNAAPGDTTQSGQTSGAGGAPWNQNAA